MIEFLYVVLLIFSTIILINYIRKGTNLLYCVFFATFILYYIFTPTILGLYGGESVAEAYQTPYLVVYRDATDLDKIRVFIITLVVTIFLIGLRRVKLTFGKSRQTVQESYLNKNTIDYEYLDKVTYTTGIVFLIIGGIALLELIIELGGLQRMLSLGSIIRGYRTDNTEYLSPLGSICKTLSVFVTGSFFCFYASSKKYKRHRLLIIISTILSIAYLLFNAGRGPLLLFFGCIFFAILKEKGRKIIWIVVIGFVAIALLSSSIEVMMNNIARGMPAFYELEYNMTDNILSTITDLAYPYSNLLALPKMIAQSGYNYGFDYIFWFSELIPKRLLGFIWSILPMNTLVTTKVSQYYIASGLSYGGTPADYITYGWFQGSILGLFVNCLIYDIIIKAMDKPLSVLPKQYSIIKYRMCFFVYSLITSNDLPLMLKNNLFLIIMILIISKALKKRVGIEYENK